MSQAKNTTLRLPEPLRADAEQLAAQEQRTLSNFLRLVIADGIAARRAAQQARAAA